MTTQTFNHILLTGGAGFIGSNFVHFLLRTRPQTKLTNLDMLTYSGNLENLKAAENNPHYRFSQGDIQDAALIDKLLADDSDTPIDAIIHMAAESHVDRSILDARPFMMTNIVGTQTLLDAVRRRAAAGHKAPRFVYVSTDEVYGSLPLDNPDEKFTEETPLAPNSPYAASKAAGDCLIRAYHHTFNLDVLATRCSNNFGPYQFPEKVIPLFVTNLLEDKPVPLYGDGRNIRDWLHVEDHCEAVLTVLEKGRAGEAYNIGGDNERSNLELTHSILDIMGKGKDMIRPVKDRPGHDLRYAIDATKIKTELGWRPTRSAWPKALEETVRWYKENQDWWRRVKSGEYRKYYETQYAGRELPV